MTGFECKKALGAGKTICGSLIVSPSPNMYASRNLAPVVRILSPDPCLAAQALDAGAQGILAPYVEKPEQVLQLVGAVHYKPIKGTGDCKCGSPCR
jgi:2-keto-3-deoxy-L-rhamnonate aldolase RhmA